MGRPISFSVAAASVPRQSLAMSAGDYGIFLQRPIAVTMLGLGLLLLLLGLKPLLMKKRDWRDQLENP